MTAGPPPSSFKTALEQMVAAGPAQPGIGLTRIGPQAADLPLASGDPRWQSQLRPDLRRAVTEIYLNFRAEGVSNTREWVSREFAQMQNTDSHTEFRLLATEVNFRLDRCPSEEGKLNLLSSDDTLEIQLRRLASKVHTMRTGDKDAASTCWRFLCLERSLTLHRLGWCRMPRCIPSRTINSMSASESFCLVASVVVETLVEEMPPNQRGKARITGNAVMKAAKTKARVAMTDVVAVAGVKDADDALRMGAGR